MEFTRYALYAVPPEKAEWTRAATAWLGWDMARGETVPHPDPGALPVAAITGRPRRYGLHGTIKPPFRLAPGATADALHGAAAALCARLAPVPLPGLEIAAMGRFLALRPTGGDTAALTALAADCVRGLDTFRAAPDAAELARRRAGGLSDAQEANLRRWGYPYVMDQFRFHITLTGPLAAPDRARAAAALERYLAPLLPAPFTLGELALVGEAPDGRFHLLHRYTLSG